MTEVNNIPNIFLQRHEEYNSKALFFHFTGEIPNSTSLSGVETIKIMSWITANYHQNVRSTLRVEESYCNVNDLNSSEKYIMMKDNIMIVLSRISVEILFDSEQESEANILFEMCKKFPKKEKNGSTISMMTPGLNGMETIDIKVSKPKFRLEENYNDDLVKLHPKILNNMRTSKSSGLILFYGNPGTGKSTYLRFLVNCLKKNVILIPPKVAGELDSPNLTSFLIENQDSIFIIEDAEELLVSRNQGNNSAISMILNLTDGILAESLGIQIIATFNTPVYNIDKALLRKGRLITMYEFKALEKSKSEALLLKLKVKDYPVHADMTLADIYNTTSMEFKLNNEEKRIGFIGNMGKK